MKSANDKLLSRLTVKLVNPETGNTLGTGVIYHSGQLKELVYVFTAAHCLYEDVDGFSQPIKDIEVQFYNAVTNSYLSISKSVNHNLALQEQDKDVAVLVFDKNELLEIGDIPGIYCVKEKQDFKNFVVKGFPNATQGKELDVIFPSWKQEMTEVFKFQLQLKEDYSQWATMGFSGSGIFLEANDEVYLFGLFARFRPEDNGRVIYCQYLETVNEILENNYLMLITFSYLGEHGMTPAFFREKTEIAIENLGPRFSENLNFKLPIARKFNDLSKDLSFKKRVYKIFDNWLTEKSYRMLPGNTHLEEAEKMLKDLREHIKVWFTGIRLAADEDFDIDWILDKIQELESYIYSKMDDLYTLRRTEEQLSKDIKKDHSYRPPYEKEIDRLYEIKNNNAEFIGKLEREVDIKLANHPLLLIKGEAGSGKSHLLGDVATEKLKAGTPAILLLGQHFSSTKSIGTNILEQLDLQCSFKEFLTAINDIGLQVNSRVLLMIDALNETKTPDLWKDHLSGFIKEIQKFQHIALVSTIRSTYFESVVPENVRENPDITIINHEGFSGNEYSALRLFCTFFGLRQPTFPILAPEFTNPLFLQLVCMGVRDSRDKSFPLGFHGVKKVFDLYLNALNKKLTAKTEYANRANLIKDAIDKIAKLCIENDQRLILLDDATAMFDKEFKKFPNLLHDLIQENVLVKNFHHDYENDRDEETIYFAYERIGDFYIAEQQLKDYKSKEAVLKAFEKEGPLAKLADGSYNDGIIEAMAVLLPEVYGIEIYEALGWMITDKGLSNSYHWENRRISDFYLNSLTWRSIGSLKSDKLLAEENLDIDGNDWLLKFMEFSAVPGHPLNSDRLHMILKKHTMPKRDGFWQSFLLKYSGYDDYGSAFSVRRLIDWAWTKDISATLDYETARLSGQALAWVLASTKINLRDQTTKAMVNLLEEQPAALVYILKAFRRTNDMYILERLYSIAYGCILRTSKKEAIKLIAEYTYNSIFKNGNPPKNILLRDYARNICEFSVYHKATLKFNMKLVRPPYQSTVPQFPTKQDVEKYKIDYSKETEKIPHRTEFNQIHHSLTDGDFGRKTVDTALSYFSPLAENAEEDLKAFSASLERGKKSLLKNASEIIELKILYHKSSYRAATIFGSQEKFDEHMRTLDDALGMLFNLFSPSQRSWMEKTGIPYLQIKAKIKLGEPTHFNSAPVKYWIVQRAFELGFDKDIHGQYDHSSRQYNNRHDNEVERIGKKYSWIAYYEILAVLADNFKLSERRGSTSGQYFQGTWQLYLRNIDPAFTTKNKISEEHEDEVDIVTPADTWWSEPKYTHWNIPAAKWASQIEDLPAAKEVILKKDDNGVEWVHLQHYVEWQEPKPLGEDRYSVARKQVWYLTQGYLVKKKDKHKIINYLADKNFWGKWMPDNDDTFSRLINREKFWSPAYFEEGVENKWETIDETDFKVIVATTQAKGSMEHDKSGANESYNIPCLTIFEGLGLKYASHDGDFTDKNGELIVTNINPKGVLVRKDKFVQFLADSNLEVIWTILGEKIADLGNSDYHFGVPCGVFSLNGEVFTGEIVMHERD